MATRVPIVEVSGELQRLQPGDDIATGASTFTKTYTSTAVPGQIVYADGNTSVDLAQANADATSKIVGIAPSGVTAAASGPVQYAGPVTLTTTEWDAVASTTGGLTANTKYYLSDTTAGMMLAAGSLTGITQGEYLVEIGRALSTTEFLFSPQRRILR